MPPSLPSPVAVAPAVRRARTSAPILSAIAAALALSPPVLAATPDAHAAITAAAPAQADRSEPAPAAPVPANAAAPGSAPTPPRPGEPPPLRPFAEVIREARELKGFLTLWQRDERTWIEVRPEGLDQPFFFGHSLAQGLGERFFFPGLTGPEQVVVLRRVGNTLQLLAQNLRVRAPAGTPLAIAVRESYSDSLLASAPVVSALHPERRSFLVDAAVLFGGDLAGALSHLEAAFRLSYTLDRANSTIERVRTTDQGTFITVRQHFSLPKLPPPPVTAPPPGTPVPTPPLTLPDARSLFLAFTFTLAPLPAEPKRPRAADQRVGHFTTSYWDFARPEQGDLRTHYVERWRLEKKDPQAELSEPKEPIVVWMDRNIPEDVREPVRAGILEWNKAFERAGFRNAIEVRQQPADADWSTLEGTRHIAVRWFAMQGPGAVAIGPSQVDPRSGEILRAAILIPQNWLRFASGFLRDQEPRLPPAVTGAEAFHATPAASLEQMLAGRQCSYASQAFEQTALAFELLVARGELAPGSEEARRFVAGALKDVTMHEMGHALGLRHNFLGSAGVRLEQLRDAAFTARRGISNSVMDYNALNIPLAGEPAAHYNQTTIGPYDVWAIEYAYRQFPPEQEAAELARIAARSALDPDLAYATDEDAVPALGGGLDPRINQFDLGHDPLVFYQRNFKLARELWQRTRVRELPAGDSFALYRRNVQRGLGWFAGAVLPLSRFVGGVYTSRRVAGEGQEPLFVPVAAERQREALAILTRELFSSDSFRFDPAFMRMLGVEHREREPGRAARVTPPLAFSLPESVLAIQRSVLDQLLGDGVAVRLAAAESKVDDRRQALPLAEVHERLADSVWSELATGAEIDSLRRNLQREHLRRVAAALVRAPSPVAADVRAVNRQVALRLQADLRRAIDRARERQLSPTTRAHLAESAALLAEALRAPLVKQGV